MSYYLLQNYLLKGQMAEINRSDTKKIVSCNKSERFFIIIVRCFGSFFKQCVSFVTERLLFMQRTKSSRLHSTCSVFALSDGAFLFKQSKVEIQARERLSSSNRTTLFKQESYKIQARETSVGKERTHFVIAQHLTSAPWGLELLSKTLRETIDTKTVT